MIVPVAPHEQLQACVTLPIKNEQELLPNALSALAHQKQEDGRPFGYSRFEVIVLVNNTSDNSFRVAQEFKRKHPLFQLHLVEQNFCKDNSHIGHVRRLLMDEASKRLEQSSSSLKVILTTDGDSQVSPNWLGRNLEEIRKGADAVGGRIVISGMELRALSAKALRLHKYDNLYRRLVCWIEHQYDPQENDPWPKHHQNFGASFAVTADIYKKVGGLPAVPELEDVAFYELLIANDACVRHSPHVRVFTSARLSGKVDVGLSSQLNEWTNDVRSEKTLLVESKRSLELLFKTRYRLRQLWQDRQHCQDIKTMELVSVAKIIGISASELRSSINQAPVFGRLLAKLKFNEKCRDRCPADIRFVPLKSFVDSLLMSFKSHVKFHHFVRAHQFGRTPFDNLQLATNQYAIENAHGLDRLPEGSRALVIANEPEED